MQHQHDFSLVHLPNENAGDKIGILDIKAKTAAGFS
jgi:hypothetical protein